MVLRFICFKKSGGKYEMEKISKRIANIWETFVGFVVACFVCATCFFGFRVRPEIEKVSKRTAFQLNIFIDVLLVTCVVMLCFVNSEL